MRIKKRGILIIVVAFILISLCILIMKYSKYELVPYSTLRPVYKISNEMYYCDPQNNYNLVKKSGRQEDIIISERVHNYWTDGKIIVYSLESGLYIADSDGGNVQRINDFSSVDIPNQENKVYKDFYMANDELMYTYSFKEKGNQIINYYKYDMSQGSSELVWCQTSENEQGLVSEKYWVTNQIIYFIDTEFYFFSDTELVRCNYNYENAISILYQTKENEKIMAAEYSEEDGNIIFVTASKDKIYLKRYDAEMKETEFIQQYDMGSTCHQVIFIQDKFICTGVQGDYILVASEGILNKSGKLSLKDNMIFSISGGDFVSVFYTYRYDARSYKIDIYNLTDMSYESGMNCISLIGNIKSRNAKLY